MSLKLAELCTCKQTPGSDVVLFQKQNSFCTGAKSTMFNCCLYSSLSTSDFVAELWAGTHHIDELCDGQSELDDDHVSDVGHGSGILVVTSKELLEEVILSMRVGLLATKNCRHAHLEY